MKICTECFNFVVKGNVYRCKVKDWKIMGRPAPDEIAEASKRCHSCKDFDGIKEDTDLSVLKSLMTSQDNESQWTKMVTDWVDDPADLVQIKKQLESEGKVTKLVYRERPNQYCKGQGYGLVSA